MIARENLISKLLEGNDKSFFIPVYQREYSWTEANCKTLLSDLEFVSSEKLDSHFFGSIVYNQKDLGGIASHCIIDGQQRITTTTLLILAIYNVLKAYDFKHPGFLRTKGISLEKIENSYFYIDPYKSMKELKLIPTDADLNEFSLLFETKDNKETGLITNVDDLNMKSNVHKNYKFFYIELQKMSIDKVIDIFNSVKKLSIVNVSLEPNDDPQLIFESINSKIKELEESDKIRNYLFMKVAYEEQKILYNNYWKNISHNVDNISKLLRFYLAIKTNVFAPEKQLYYYFKSFMNNHKELNSESILKEILKYSTYMKDMLSYDQNSTNEYQKSIYRINKLDMSTIYPVLFICFDALNQAELTTDELDEILLMIESYLVRRNFMKLPIASLNKVFAFMPAEVNKYLEEGHTFKDSVIYSLANKTANTRFPKDNEFNEAFKSFELYNAKSAIRKYVLERLSNYNNKEIIDVDKDIETGKLTIEHVMPQTLSKEWKEYLGENYERIHSKYLDTIGNLTLTAYNSEYSNSSFDEKKNLKDKGFLYSSLYLNQYIKNCSEWKEQEIVERSNILFDRAIKIWPSPTILVKETEFDLMKPETWDSVPITQFAKFAFDYMLTNNILDASDIIVLTDRVESKKQLRAYYAVLTDNRKPEGCKKAHWSKKEYIIYGKVMYLSTEWFKEQYDYLCKYVREKLHI